MLSDEIKKYIKEHGSLTLYELSNTVDKIQQLEKDKQELAEALKESCQITCELCIRLNPQHKSCLSCDDEEWKHELLEKHYGKKWEE